MYSTEDAESTMTTPMNVSARVGPRINQYADLVEGDPVIQSHARATRGTGPLVITDSSWSAVLVSRGVYVAEQWCNGVGECFTTLVVVVEQLHGRSRGNPESGTVRG